MLTTNLSVNHEQRTRSLIAYYVILLGILAALALLAWDTLPESAIAASSAGKNAPHSQTGDAPLLTDTPTVPPCGPDSNYVFTTGAGSIIPGTSDTGNHCDDCTTTIALPFAFNFYGNSFTGANVSSNGNLQFTSNSIEAVNACLPYASFNNAIMPHWDDLNTSNNTACPSGTCGIFTRVIGSSPTRTFYIEWRATYFGTSTYVNFEIELYESLTPSGLDFVYGAVPQNGIRATVGVQRGTGSSSQFTQYACGGFGGVSTGLRIFFRQPVCPTNTPISTPTVTGTPPTVTGTPPTATRTFTQTPTSTPTPTEAPCGPNSNYAYTTSTGVSVYPATTQTANHCDDCTTNIALPFPFTYYGTSFTSANVSSNGNLQFSSSGIDNVNQCLTYAAFNNAIMPHWDDLNTSPNPACPGGTCGIYTVVIGSVPGIRQFAIEWRATYFGTSTYVNFEIILYENQSQIDFIYGAVPQSGSSATVGIQRGTGSQYTVYECSLGILSTGLRVVFTQPVCATNTPTITPTRTFTPTITSTLTDTPTLTPTPIPTTGRVLVGHVTWQGRPAQPNALQQLPITLTLKVGSTEVNYPSQSTDASGFFTVSVANLVVGATFNWRAKGPDGLVKTLVTDQPGFLASTGAITLLNAAQTNLEIGQMRAGDCNNDNVVSVQDFNILKGTFGKTQGDAGYDNRADFTGDHLVSSTDFNLLKGNFAQVGSPPLGPVSP